MHILNCTTPAQYFHALRRQLLRPFRKPLVLMTPKTLLRHPSAVSSLPEMEIGTTFQPVLASTLDGRPWKGGLKGREGDEREGGREGRLPPTVLLCCGKIYYDIVKDAEGRKDLDPSQILLLRLEELSPFPRSALAPFLPPALPLPSSPTTYFWVQEEPWNAGAWAFISSHLRPSLPALTYIGPPPLPTPAVGTREGHAEERERLLTTLWENVREGGAADRLDEA
ncbi:2-oxoglutarate e1 subunit [Nannochloropsis gaditana]|uniref:2-oxoglutarate e1 subunit n=1 Tax=Nannochloropsis gaditana TaxID=72520 RepID=W7TU13_9STRA|nr:2-oxoglutarate e1 subunit [Nannochloropsis gaditana]